MWVYWVARQFSFSIFDFRFLALVQPQLSTSLRCRAVVGSLGLIIAVLVQRAGSASGQSTRDRSGRAPRPARAIDSCGRCAIDHYVHALGGARCRVRDLLRTPRRRSARVGYFAEIAGGLILEAAWPSSVPDRGRRALDSGCATPVRSWQRVPDDMPLSTAVADYRSVTQRTTRHSDGRCGADPCLSVFVANEMPLRISASRIDYRVFWVDILAYSVHTGGAT